MEEVITVDFGKTSRDYAAHRAGFPPSFFERLAASGWLEGCKDVLDIGTGTGTIARGLAQRGFNTAGLDPSENQIAAARKIDAAAHLNIPYTVAPAEDTGLPTNAFDAVTAGQCWHWFDQKRVLAEISRLLRPGGKLVVAYFDWVETPGNPVAAMTVLREKYNPRWRGVFPLGFYPQGPGDFSFPGFTSQDSFAYEENIPYTHEGWRGRMRAYAGIGGSLTESAVAAFDHEFAEVLKKQFPQEPMQVPHKIWAEMWVRTG